MTIIYIITASLILLYLTYPFSLMAFPAADPGKKEYEGIDAVSVILLSRNGKKYLKEKIQYIIHELAPFKNAELIVIDDLSTDGSKEVLKEFENRDDIKIVLKDEQRGIPHTMNMGVEMAKYPYIIFCDQRQVLSEGILKKITEPLMYENTGAVSACISHLDTEGCCSWIRKFENFIKSRQSLTGSLIGVYGPLYAIKKKCFTPIPEEIILDDLYLSLSILRTRSVLLKRDCIIRDENFSSLNNPARAKRYLEGFLQLFRRNSPVRALGAKHLIMLFWHKYMRLLFPIFLFLSYVVTAIRAFESMAYFIAFVIITLTGVIMLFPGAIGQENRLRGIININIWYLLGLPVVLFRNILPKNIPFKAKNITADKKKLETDKI